MPPGGRLDDPDLDRILDALEARLSIEAIRTYGLGDE
jgi:hypothetical protein